MSIISQKINIDELNELLQYFFENTCTLNNNFKKQCKELTNKLLVQTKEKIIDNHTIIFGIKQNSTEVDKIRKQNILSIKNTKFAFIYYQCLQDVVAKENKSITILKTKYNKELFEYEEFFDAIACLFMYSNNPTSKSISIEKIDNILNNKKIAKNVRNNKNVAIILSNRKDDKYFRTHPKTDDNIVPIEKLGKYLEIGDKYKYIECPICGNDIKINADTINNIIEYKKKRKSVQIVCNHEHTNYIKEMLFSFTYEHENIKAIPMYVLNNYNHLVNKFLTAPQHRKINKKSKLMHTNQLHEYLDIGNKYIFLEHPIKKEPKIKVTKDNLIKIFTISDDRKKNFIHDSNKDYKKVAYINIDDVENYIETLFNSTETTMTILNNYNLLLLKNLIHNMD